MALPTRFETDIAVARDLAALGDSHDPDDPYFADFKKKVLAQYGVSKVEDLPVNYKGLLGMEGERLTSALFERYANASFDRQDAQLRRVDGIALLSPVIALRRLSMAAAGTDLQNHRNFVQQAEHHRYRLVQELNRLQAEKLSFAGDRSSRDSRISRAHWHDFAEFHYRAASPVDRCAARCRGLACCPAPACVAHGSVGAGSAPSGEDHAMNWLAHEWRLLSRSRLTVIALALLLVLSALAVISGAREVARQQQTMTRLAELQQRDLAVQARKHTHGGDAGSAAYYTFHGTWDAPSSTAFLALGLRDAVPYVLRVRALALQAQLHEGESFNPELALAGRFDFAFVLVYLAPLFVIALLYDLVSGDGPRAGCLR